MTIGTRPQASAWQAEVKLRRQSFERVPPKGRPAVEPDSVAQEQEQEKEQAQGESVAGERGVADDETMWVRFCVVEFSRPGVEPVRFRVNALDDGRFTFSDPRGRNAGTAGTTGIWGTLPALRAPRPRSLTPTEFKAEAARYVGIERAGQVVEQAMNEKFFSRDLRHLRDVFTQRKRG
jgi:hypothetical protein